MIEKSDLIMVGLLRLEEGWITSSHLQGISALDILTTVSVDVMKLLLMFFRENKTSYSTRKIEKKFHKSGTGAAYIHVKCHL